MRRRRQREHEPWSETSFVGRGVGGLGIEHLLDVDRPFRLIDEQKTSGRKAPAVDVKVDGIVRRAVELDDGAGAKADRLRERKRRAAELRADTHADVADGRGGKNRLCAVEQAAS